MRSIETALVILVPEAEALVRPFREKHDPSAADGMPAHITLLYPFKALADIGPNELKNLGDCFARFAPFGFTLASTGRFAAHVLYLVPAPDEPFRQLTMAVWERFPETPPYSGKFPDVVPHLTVAEADDDTQLDRIADDFTRALMANAAAPALAAEVALMDNSFGTWQVRTLFGLGSAPN
jgi:2'-5' RNA ligase